MQKVNLYLPEFRQKRDILSPTQFLMFSIIGGAIYVGFGYLASTQTRDLQIQLTQQTATLAQLRGQLQEMESLFADEPTQSDIESEIEKAQKTLQKKSAALQTLQNADISASSGFSQLVLELAKHSDSRMWFTQVRLQTDILELKGQTTDPSLVAWWIESSKPYPSLRRNFTSVNIDENKIDKRVYDFHLKNGVSAVDDSF